MAGKIKIILLSAILLGTLTISAQALDMPKTNSYIYSTSTGSTTVLNCPMPFLPEKTINLGDQGAGIQSPVDMCFDGDSDLYIVDNTGNCIVEFDAQYKVKNIIKQFTNNGNTDSFNGPTGMYITESGLIYICDAGNDRIVELDQNFKLVRIYTTPKAELLGKNYIFSPQKVAVDPSGDIFLINQNEFNGIMQLDSNGNFVNFIGSNKVVFNPVDAFWKSIMTNTQRSQLLQFVPIEYTNISMDSQGFLYAVTSAEGETQPIKRLNLSGSDVLSRNGYVGVTGDIDLVNTSTNTMLKSSFVDIVSDKNGVYYALDSAKGRIFAYNQDGYLLYVFGGMGNKAGLFSAPCAIETDGSHLFVLDQTNNTLTIFKQTEYASLIEQADLLFHNGDYKQSQKFWNQVLNLNSNFELAYSQIGSIYLAQDKYKEAMKYFILGNYRGNPLTQLDGYNKAFAEYSKIFAKKYVGFIVAGIIVIMIGIVILKRAIRKYFLKKKRSKDLATGLINENR